MAKRPIVISPGLLPPFRLGNLLLLLPKSAPVLRPVAQVLSSNRYGFLVTVVAFVVYLRTLAPTIMWYDMGEFALGSQVLGIGHNTGYPLYMMVGKLFTFLPVGDIAYRVNLMSAVFASLAVLLVFLIVRRVTYRELPALVAAATLAASSTFWSNALWAEAHPLNAFSTALIIYLMLVWRDKRDDRLLYAAFLTFGLSLGNHRLVLWLFPAMVAFVLTVLGPSLRSMPWRHLLLAGASALVGFAVHLYLPLRGMQDPLVTSGDPSSLRGFANMVFMSGVPSSDYFNFSPEWFRWVVFWAFPAHDLTVFGVALALGGAAWLFRRDRGLFVLTLIPVVLTAGIILIYRIHDIYDYFIPIYLVMAIWLGTAVGQLGRWLTWALSKARVVLRPRVGEYALYAMVFLPAVLFLRNFHTLDRSDDYEAFDFAYNALSGVPRDSVIVADWWGYYPLLYQQVVNGLRRDVLVTKQLAIIDEAPIEFIDEMLDAGRKVYIAEGLSDVTDALASNYILRPIALQAITSVPLGLPYPEHKDLLVLKRDFYQVVRQRPTPAAGQVPAGVEQRVRFNDELTLVGLAVPAAEVPRGGSFPIEYYWRLEQELADDLYFKVDFVDEEGRVPQKQGFPLWFQAGNIGAGARPTSEWVSGQIAVDRYHTLVPRQVPPGNYHLLLKVYDGKSQARELAPSIGLAGGGAIVGQITVY